ncbi:Receptor-type tyrosine-protein phosphatase alpha [Oopsacas minuta]|uniref:protein-tyrosine-phosphatase n=1 Tax=Oopsacas minuta TaxID=111878 RepID=A0AAV7JTK9_9METZ|nr:Receptor-type tyrosine-protein phosphatase alpha [Oopsacas minuta]
MDLLILKILFYFSLTVFTNVHSQDISVEMAGVFVTFTSPFLVLNSGEPTRIKCTSNTSEFPEWVDPNNADIISSDVPAMNENIFAVSNTTEVSSTLTFTDNNISTEMEGEYACRIGSTTIFLPIFVMIPFLDVTIDPTDSSVIVTQGSGIMMLSCSSLGYPTPTITVSESLNLVETLTSTTSPVDIDITTLSAGLYNFTCSAVNSYKESSLEILLTLLPVTEIVLTPVEFLRTPFDNQSISTVDTNSPSYAIRVGSAFNLSCPFTEFQYPSPVTWTYTTLGGTGSSSRDISIPILTMEHAGNYTCGYLTDTVTLEIVPSSYRVLIQRNSVATPVAPTRIYQITTMDTVLFICIGTSTVDLSTEGWFYPSGGQVTSPYGGLTTNVSQMSVTYELTFDRAYMNLTGSYTCRVRGEDGVLNQLTVIVNISAVVIPPTTTPIIIITTPNTTNPNTIVSTSISTVTNDTNNSTTTVLPSGLTSIQLTLITAISLLFVFIVLMCIVTLICCIVACRITYMKSNISRSKSIQQIEESLELSIYNPIARCKFSGSYRKLSQDGNLGFVEQFKKLPTDTGKPSEMAQADANSEMNRDKHIVPFDDSRVILSPDDSGSDYINASFINGAFLPNRYIAAQAPMEAFVDHFWRMIWEHDVKVIVMLTKISECGIKLSYQYWPTSRPTQTYGIIIVDILEVTELRHCIIQTFKIKRMFEGKSRVVKHFQFLSWPENNVPDYPTSLITFTRRIRGYVKKQEIEAPILVHCNLGIGRTGSWIAIDILWDKLEWDDTSIDVYGCCCLLNMQRKHMIQYISQYVFTHRTIKELTETGNTEFEMEMFQHKFQEKIMIVQDHESLLGKEFKLLTTQYPNEQFRTAQLIENKNKNRYSHCIPIEEHRVILPKKSGDMYSDYINASYIDGNVRTSQFIITQTPCKANLEDFWRMVLLTRSEIMVIFPSPTKGSSSRRGSHYYPNLRAETVEGIYTISCLEDKTCEGFQYRIIGVKNTQDNTYLNLHHFQFLRLPNPGIDMVDSYQSMHNMLHAVKQKSYEVSKGGPITMHCSSGCGWSAVFIALFVLFDHLEKDSCIDVFQTVKALRLQRPYMVETLEQYEYIHQAVLEKFYPTLAHV